MKTMRGSTREEWIDNTLEHVRKDVHANLDIMTTMSGDERNRIEETVMNDIAEAVESLRDVELRTGEQLGSLIAKANCSALYQLHLHAMNSTSS